MKLVYTDDAIEDLKRLRSFIAQHNPAAASKVTKELTDKINFLLEFPALGVEVERATDPKTIRDIVFGNYVVRYSLHDAAIIILRVWHGLEDGC